MTNHPITPPPALVEPWLEQSLTSRELAAKAFQAGADQELEACCDSLQELWAPSEWITGLRAKRRPKPPTLKEQALKALDSFEGFTGSLEEVDVIRRALEQLDD